MADGGGADERAAAGRLDAVVVGAGPAGAATAYHLATRGRRVLLVDRRTFPRDKCCGDGLTRAAVRRLAEMGVLDELPGARRVGGVRIRMRHRGTRDFWYDTTAPFGYGLVVPRAELDAKLCDRAVRAGATLWAGARATYLLGEPGAVRGVEIERDGRRMAVRAPVVVAADGAGSGLGRQAGLNPADRDWTGFAARGYFGGVVDLPPLLEIHLPLFDVTARHLLPSYGWVFPVGGGVVNVGVGLFDPDYRDSVRSLYDRFVAELLAGDPRFRRARPTGRMSGAPLRLDFDPARCGVPGLLLVGDAAGLASPFTGEGISFALESGVLAAEHIDTALRQPGDDPVDPGPYARALGARQTGYFESGRYAVRRYLLAWRLLESTFQDDRPIFALCRRLVLFPDDVRPGTVLEPLPRADPAVARSLRRDLRAVADLLAGCVREDWPMFVRLVSAGDDPAGLALRPATLLLLAGYVGGRRHPARHALAAAVDLGLLAALALDGAGAPVPPPAAVPRSRPAQGPVPGPLVPPARRPGPAGTQPVLWGSRFAVLVADFLLARAYQFAAEVGAAVVAEFAEALSVACEGRARELWAARLGSATGPQRSRPPAGAPTGADPPVDDDWAARIEVLADRTALTFELPCRLGARLAGARPAVVEALAGYGRRLGVAHALAEELRPAGSTTFGRLTAVGGGRVVPPPADPARVADLGRVVARQARLAREALAGVPGGPVRDLLLRLAEQPLAGLPAAGGPRRRAGPPPGPGTPKAGRG